MTEPPEEPTVPRPRYADWCEKNAKPKRSYWPRSIHELTPWQKRGPMSRRDWVRFYVWASKNALPKEIPEPKLEEDEDEADDTKKKKRKKKPKTLDELLVRVETLAKPRNPRDKYKYPPKPNYAYSPKIYWNSPPHHDPGRPFQSVIVPKEFYHIELENNFWSQVRFPIIRGALKYNASENIKRLAVHRERPPPMERWHCPIPERPLEYVAPRRRMRYYQWKEHLRRLEYLSKPTVRPTYVYVRRCR